jgi:hypothetical protein
LKKVGVNGYEYYLKSKKKFVVASRDFPFNLIFNIEEDGTIISCASTDNFKGTMPEQPNTVRAESPMSGYIIAPKPGDPTKSIVTLINELNLKGVIPEFAMRQAAKDQGYSITRLRKVLPKWKA